MSEMTSTKRIQNLEARLETLERLFIEFRRDNAHQSVGGGAWVKDDIADIEKSRHTPVSRP